MAIIAEVVQRGFLSDLVRRAVPQAVLLVAIGTAIGFGLNTRRTDPLPLDLPGFLLLTESGAPAVFPGKAHEIFLAGDYVFVDAREPEMHIAQHIPGSLSLPLARFEELLPELRLWTAGQPILVFGSAADFVSVDDLARRLVQAGETDVALLAPGIEAWAERGLPVESGSEGLLDPAGGEGFD